eukprot:scaffold24837_cov105-Isochrysis_galbana.AAC.1
MVRRQLSGSSPPVPQMDAGNAVGTVPSGPIWDEPAGDAVPPAARTAISRALTRSTISMLGSTATTPGKGWKGICTSGKRSETQ